MVERNYELRTLCADDIFPMLKIISKIGIDDIANCFDAKEMSEVMEAMKPAEDEESEVGTAEKANELLTQQIGIRVLISRTVWRRCQPCLILHKCLFRNYPKNF